MSEIIALYADGGVIGPNPSVVGGSWAYCLVGPAGRRLQCDSGVITPEQAGMETITNNLTEQLALVNGLLALPAHWRGTVYSDSQIALYRLFHGWKMTHLPAWLISRGSQALQRVDLANITTVLLNGHPTKAQLAAGVGKRGGPVSIHNKWCDEACTKASKEYRDSLRLAAAGAR